MHFSQMAWNYSSRLGSDIDRVHLSTPSALTRKVAITSPPSPCAGDLLTIRRLTSDDRRQAVEVINTAAAWYREFLPPEELHDPEMDEAAWETEAVRMTWWGGVRGRRTGGRDGKRADQGSGADAPRVRAAPDHQRQGASPRPCSEHVEERLPLPARIVVGTYAANYKARGQSGEGGVPPFGGLRSRPARLLPDPGGPATHLGHLREGENRLRRIDPADPGPASAPPTLDVRLPGGRSVGQEQGRLLEVLDQHREEPLTRASVDHPVVERQRERHHRRYAHHSVSEPRAYRTLARLPGWRSCRTG